MYQFDFSSNSIGYKAGVNYKVNDKTHFTAGLNLFRAIFNGFGYHQEIQTVDLSISAGYYPTQAQIDQGIEYVQYLTNIKSRDSRSYFSYIIPEFTINHEIFNNTFLTFGTRFKFWSPKLTPERFSIKVDGYLDNINAEFETFHESEITNKGFFMYLGLKYNIPLLRDKKSKTSKP
jgi:hypothetical protein